MRKYVLAEAIHNFKQFIVNVARREGSDLRKKFSGKKIIWLGDSIHAFAKWDGLTIPYLFGCHSGAICYNWAQGGMTMAKTGIENYACYSGVGMVEALISKDFSAQEAYAYEDHGAKQGNFYQQVKEMKTIDLNTVDAVIIEFGTNDTLEMIPLDNKNNLFDIETTGGALRYMISKLKTNYPNLKIFVLNVQRMNGWADAYHTVQYDSRKQNDVIQNICKTYDVAVIDIYNLLADDGMTKEDLLQDGLHRSHKGKIKQAKIIEQQLCLHFNGRYRG